MYLFLSRTHVSDERFDNINCTQKPLNLGEYENCTFRNCNFEYLNISGFRFTDCEFIESNLSMTNLIGSAFREVVFKACQMYG
ncbi:pentapeptide repeat-containing protein, partial [Flavobacteriaceae bacterium W22]|nr:pentapeptide repeat-containing protein [Flavobacteriaceae bacterium W22]